MAKWSIELGGAVILTVLVWVLFQALFPDDPLGLPEVVLVLAVFYVVARGIRWAVTRGRKDKDAGETS